MAIAALAALGLGLRIWFALAVTEDSSLVGDGAELHGLALRLAEGDGYVSPFAPPGEDAAATAHKPPLYPLVLALVSLLGWTSPTAHQIASAAIGAGTVVVAAVLAWRFGGPRAAVAAAAIGAVYPVFLVADASLRSETLYALCVALSLLAAYRAWERPTTWRLAQLGVIVGLSALTRSEGILLLALLAPVVWGRGRRDRVRRLAVIVLACALTLAPWLIRCFVVFDEPVAISTSYGDLIAGANCDATYSGAGLGSWAFECVSATGGDEAEIARRLRARGLRYARDNAERLPPVLAARALRPWGLYDPAGEARGKTLGEGKSLTANWIGLAACWTLMALALLGFLALRRRRRPLFLLLAPFLLVVIVSITSYGILRFRAPADVALVVLGGVGIDALRRRRPAR